MLYFEMPHTAHEENNNKDFNLQSYLTYGTLKRYTFQDKYNKERLTSTSDKCPANIRRGWILSIDQIRAVRSCDALAK